MAPQRRDCRFPNKKFFQVPQSKRLLASLPSRTLWIFLMAPIACTQWDTGCPISFPSLPFHLGFLNPMTPHAYSCSSGTLLGPEPWAQIYWEEMLPFIQIEKLHFCIQHYSASRLLLEEALIPPPPAFHKTMSGIPDRPTPVLFLPLLIYRPPMMLLPKE